MSTTTPNRGLKKAEGGDDVEQTAIQDYAANFDNLDTHTHPASDISGIATQTGLDAEATARAAADTTEATARAAGDSTEATARAAADTAEASARATADTAEATTRASADTTNASNLTSHTGATGTAVHGLGTMSTQAASGVAITGGTISGITALGVPAGGTGAGTLTGLVKGNGTSAMTAVTAPTGAVVGTTDSQTLTNKTLTSPLGIVKGDVGLGNVVNSDATNATNLASGTVAVARMGSGSPSAANFLRGDGAWSALTTNTDGGGAATLFVGATAPVSPADGDLWFDTARVETKFETGSWPAVTEANVTATANTYTRTVVTPSSQINANAFASLGRIATTGATGNDRRMLTFDAMPAVDDSTITSLWAQHTWQAGQFGHVHRLQNIGTAQQVGVVVWQDDVFGLDDVINIALWQGNTSGTFAHSVESQSPTIDGLLFGRQWDLKSYSVTTNVATFVTQTAHQIEVGDFLTFKLSVAGGPAGTATVASIVDAFTFTIAWTTANIGATTLTTSFVRQRKTLTGSVEGFTTGSIVPLWVSSRLEGDVISVKAWRWDQTEPSWSDPNYVESRTMVNAARPVGLGKNGVIFGHVVTGGPMDYGPIRITRAVPGIKARVSSAWVSLSQFTR